MSPRPIYACDGRSDLFFAEDKTTLAYAATLCDDCPNLAPCLHNELAMMRTNGNRTFGVFGGTNARDRQRITTDRLLLHNNRPVRIDWTVMRPGLRQARLDARVLRATPHLDQKDVA